MPYQYINIDRFEGEPKTYDPEPDNKVSSSVGIAFAKVLDCVNDFINENIHDPNIEKFQRYLYATEELLEQIERTGELSMETEHLR
jgi:hypothetical protein